MTRCLRSALRPLLLLMPLFALLPSLPAHAQVPSSRPLRFIVPFPAGGPTDTVARAVTAELGKVLQQTVVVENIAGAGGSLGMAALAKAAPDGHTLGLATTGTHAVNPHLYGTKLGYQALKDFTPITTVVSYVNVLVVHPQVPVRNVAELVQYAKAHPDKVNFASSGNGSTNHLSGELLKTLTGAPMTHIPYRGGAQALADVIGGSTTLMFDLLVSSLPHVKSGRLRALAVTSAQRSPFAPDVPTMDEAGIAGYAAAGSDLWFGIVAPAGLPTDITERLNNEIVRILRQPELQERFKAQFLEVRTSTPQAFAQTLQADHEKWGRVVKAAGAKLD